MCGIAGFTRIAGPNPDRCIQDAIATIIHRGPDQQGVFESAHACLGTARLKILDLGGGDQPLHSQDRDVVISFNGEIYNHQDVRVELAQKGHVFQTHCDTETILEAFLEWDVECFSRLRGMFAIALWTESTNRLILARDRIGIKPLYVSKVGSDILFGSEMKTLFVYPEVGRNLNLAALDCYLSLNYVPCPLTLVEGIEKLPPGTWLEWKDGQTRQESFWTLPSGSPKERSLESSTEELDELLTRSVKEHLLSDVPLGLWLSGGVDSSTILHYAAATSATPIQTFSISFDGRSFNDGDYSKLVASHYGTRHEQLNFTEGSGLQEAIEEFAYYADDPNADAGALPVWFLSKMTRRNVTVALSGEGADELFGGYLTYRADELSKPVRRLSHSALALALRLSRLLPVSDDKIAFEYKVKRFLEGCQMPFERAHVFWNGTFTDTAKQEMLKPHLPAGLKPILDSLKISGNNLKSLLRFDQAYFMPDDILAKVDRISMAHSIEVRPPFLDHRIIEFAAALPVNLQMHGSRQKVILRELMKDKLPASVLTRKKVGFDIPAHEWLRGPLKDFMLEVLNSGMSAYPKLFKRPAVERCIQRHLDRVENLGYHLWGLLILCLWMKRWKIEFRAAGSL